MLRAARSPAAAVAALVGGTLVAAVAGAAHATTISGAVRAPADRDPALEVHAWSAATGKRYSTRKPSGTLTYSIDVPAGRYVVFAVPSDPGAPPLYAGHTQFTLCARDPAKLESGACREHALVEVEVGRRKVDGVDVTDWFLDGPTVADLARALDRPGDSWTEAELAAPKFTEYPAARYVGTTPGTPGAAPPADAAAASSTAGATPVAATPPAATATNGTAAATPPPVAPATAALVLSTADPADPRLERDRDALVAALALPPNFAGRFALVRVPCAPEAPEGCAGAAVVDVATGRVAYPPALNPLPPAEACLDRVALQFRSDSRLLTLTGRDGAALVTRYFVWNADSSTLRIVASLASEAAERCPKPR